MCIRDSQSTVNPNMPLRDLLYITAEYSRLVETQSLYSSAIQDVYKRQDSNDTNKINLKIDSMSSKNIGVDGLKVDTEENATNAIDRCV